MRVTESYGAEEPAGWDEEGHDPGIEGLVLAGRYRILRRLGQGGMATVYAAEHAEIGRPCAIKVLSPAYASDPESVERFLREARASSKIRHPNVIEIFDFGRSDGLVFFVMELLDGEDLLSRIERRGHLPWAEAQGIFLQVCEALAAAHKLGIVHRDLKPENCFCTTNAAGAELVKVLDFGIAKVNSSSIGQGLTQAGRVFGTPAYMSPEQAEGAEVDHRTDIYSLGVTMYQALTGSVPFTSDTPLGFLKQHLYAVPRAPRALAPRAEIPLEVEAIVLKALQKDPSLRFQTMAELGEALRDVGTGRGPVKVVAEDLREPETFVGKVMGFQPEARSRRWLLLAGLAAGLALVAGLTALRGDAEPAPPPDPPPPAPVAVAQPPEPPPPPPVRLRFESATPAEVLDATTREVLGRTGEDLTLPRSSSSRQLLLQAAGYEDLQHAITPDHDQTLKVELVRKSGKKKRVERVETKKSGVDLTPLRPEFGKDKKR